MSVQNVPLEIPLHHISQIPDGDHDDAFVVADESEHPIFSRDAIRDEFARNTRTAQNNQSDTYGETNKSISAEDINGGAHKSPAVSADESVLSAELSQISLSNDAHDIVNHSTDPDTHTDHSQSDAPYPSIVIDVSESSARVILAQDHTSTTLPSDPRPSPAPFRSLSPKSMSHSLETKPQNGSTSTSEQNNSPPETTKSIHRSSLSSENPRSAELAVQKPPGHRPLRSTGPSMFEQVRSKTRPMFLPPKPKAEDEKHLADWEDMMRLSRIAAEKRRVALHERRIARERQIDASLLTWEREIMPDWRVVHKSPQMRKIWWKGIPTQLRASLWEKAVGNALALSKDHFRSCLSRAKRALAANLFPQATLDLIQQDIRSTLPSLHLFHPESGPLYTDLEDMLYAWVVARSDEGLGYTYGAAKIAGMILIVMPKQQAFNAMRNLLERHCIRSFYGGERSKDDVEAYYRIFDTLLADGMPKIYFNFKQHHISPAAYLSDWFVTLFLDHLPFEACARLWDVIILEGDAFLYRVALGMLAVLESRLFFPDRTELLDLLRGENKAALEVAKREGRILQDGKYEIYGVDEEILWERIDAIEDWWKESTWTRLTQRELPDI